jgi:hypothetical protein
MIKQWHTLKIVRKGTSFVEIMVAMAILALSIIPIYEFYTKLSEVPAVSEDILYAEVLATRVIERYSGFSFEEIEAMAGQKNDNILNLFFEEDREEDWFGEIPEYKRNLGISNNKFKGRLIVSKVDEGLMALDIMIQWSPSSRGSDINKMSTYTLMKFVSQADLGIKYQKKEPEL